MACALFFWNDENSLLLQTELEKYFQNYLPCFRSEPQRKLFRTFITGLLSLLERKSIEPAALHFSGEKYVRPMQQFFPRKHPVLSTKPVSVRETAEDSSAPWESVVLAEGTKGPIVAERKYMRCYSCRKDGNRSYVKPGPEIWLYLRKYARFQCPGKSGCPGTGQGSNLKNHHMLFVMIAHLFTIYMREVFKKKKFHWPCQWLLPPLSDLICIYAHCL